MTDLNKTLAEYNEAINYRPGSFDLAQAITTAALPNAEYGGIIQQSRVTAVHRDTAGNVIGSTEMIEQTAVISFTNRPWWA